MGVPELLGLDVSLPLLFGGGVVVVIILLVLLAKFSPASGADILDFHPERNAERRAEAEADDTAQLLEIQNRRRRAQGLPELGELEVQEQTAADIGDPRPGPPA